MKKLGVSDDKTKVVVEFEEEEYAFLLDLCRHVPNLRFVKFPQDGSDWRGILELASKAFDVLSALEEVTEQMMR